MNQIHKSRSVTNTYGIPKAIGPWLADLVRTRDSHYGITGHNDLNLITLTYYSRVHSKLTFQGLESLPLVNSPSTFVGTYDQLTMSGHSYLPRPQPVEAPRHSKWCVNFVSILSWIGIKLLYLINSVSYVLSCSEANLNLSIYI